MKVCRLSAAQEVQLGQEAGRAFAFLCGLAGEGMDRTRREQLWAVANNAALLRFSLKEGEYPVFFSAVELLHRMELGQIARLAQQYQQRFEERA